MSLKILSTSVLRNSKKISLFQFARSLCSGLQEQTVKVEGQTINFIKAGHGDKTVLCFPGALGTIWSDFKPQITDLNKDKFTVVAWDPPGYGHSRPPERNFNVKFYENDADSAVRFLQTLGLNKVSLLGWSDGGISSMIIAAKYPKLVDKLIIWGSNVYIISEEVKSYEKIRDISNWSDKMKAPLIKLYTEAGLQQMWNDWCDAVGEMYRKNNGNICKEVLKNIQCPTLILHGDKDPMVAAEHPEYLLSNIPGATLHRFPEGKHNIHLRFAKEFNEIVTNFLLKN